jgi:VanZ family protein
MTLSQQRKLTFGALILYWPVLFIVAHIPLPQLVRRADVSDKSLHFTAYLILVFLLWFVINPQGRASWRRAAVWLVLLALAAYGIVDELLQTFVSGRSCDARDFAADLVGVLTGLVLFSLFSFWPALLMTVGITIFALTNTARANLAELVPVINAMFNFFAYGFFTIVWTRCIYLFLTPKAPSGKWFITAFTLPMVFLLAVRIFSTILGKVFVLQDIVISIAGIASAVSLVYLLSLLRRTHI